MAAVCACAVLAMGGPKAKMAPMALPEEALVGFAVRDVATGKVLAQKEAQRNFIPGSTLKLITAQMALESLGPDRVFVTQLLYSGVVADHVLKGDLVIRGDGDPALGSQEFGPAFQSQALFAAWKDSLKAKGIAGMEGSLLADASALTNTGADPSMLWEDIGNYYAPLATGLAYLDNAYAIRFQGNPRVGEPLPLLGTDPTYSGIERFDNRLLSGPAQSRDSAYIFGAAPSLLRILRGTYPAGHWEFRIRGALPDPGWTLTREFKAYLQTEGFRIKETLAPKACQPSPASALSAAREPVATWRSPPVSALLRRMLVFSDNHVAAHLFAQSAKAMKQPGSREGGLKAFQILLAKENGIARQMVIYDGAGLSPLNRVSPAQFTLWLQRAARNASTFPILRESMPGAAGAEAKLARYGDSLRGRLWAKTGTLEGVAALAGFLKTKSGRMVCFALYANHFAGQSSDVQAAFAPLLQQWQKL